MKIRLRGRAGSPASTRPPSLGEVAILAWSREVVSRVSALEPETRSLSDDELCGLTGRFRGRLQRGEPLDDVLPQAFAAVREVAVRTLGQRHFDAQIMAGAVTHRGMVAEMRTGEGKTLTATLPAYLNALTGAGVHVMTANDYLARRDWEWMRPVYAVLGVDPGLLQAAVTSTDVGARRAEYGADITYGSWEQFGYDYLRDNLAWSRDEQVQRGHQFLIVDEADLILVDQMRSPLMISGPVEQAESRHAEFAELAAALARDVDYQADEHAKTVSPTESGIRLAERRLGVSDLYSEASLALVRDLGNALRAKEFFCRDRDYVVDGSQIVVIDETSGRRQHGRTFSGGIHQAIQAKEGLPVDLEQQPLATVPLWDYLGQYQRLGAMTGVAVTDTEVYQRIYGLDVVSIPTNKPVIRVDHRDAIYSSHQAKLAGLADETARRHAEGQPVLIGTSSIEEADEVSRLLTDRVVSHNVLTARNPEREAEIIAGAGGLGAVTVVAKMAGRGVDIILGAADASGRATVAGLGGLCVLGAERSDNRRVELHLRGRAGRQGDPGESKFFVSFEDDLVRRMFGGKLRAFLGSVGTDGSDFERLSRAIGDAQVKTAAGKAAWLLDLRAWDDVLCKQRHVIYADRRTLVEQPESAGRQIAEMIDDVVRAQVTESTKARHDGGQLLAALRKLYPAGIPPQELGTRQADPSLADRIADDAKHAHARRAAELGPQVLQDMQRKILLGVTDQAWRDHLLEMAALQDGIGLRALAGRSPLAEYQREAARLFDQMRFRISVRAVCYLFSIQP